MPPPIRAVYDCMVFLQAVANPRGPAFRCFEAVESKQTTLLVCPSIVIELHDVLNRAELRTRFRRLTPDSVAEFLRRILSIAEQRPDPGPLFTLPRDPDDEVYLNLALEGQANHLVTWNERHLTYLMTAAAPEAIDFRQRYPNVTILDPPAYLRVFTSGSPKP